MQRALRRMIANLRDMTQLRDQLISANEAAELMRESRRTVLRKAKDGTYPAIKMPGQTGAYIFNRPELERIAAQR